MAKYVQPENMIEELGDHCQPGMCQPIRSGDNSTLTVSAVSYYFDSIYDPSVTLQSLK